MIMTNENTDASTFSLCLLGSQKLFSSSVRKEEERETKRSSFHTWPNPKINLECEPPSSLHAIMQIDSASAPKASSLLFYRSRLIAVREQ
jgi:hypothetical protein